MKKKYEYISIGPLRFKADKGWRRRAVGYGSMQGAISLIAIIPMIAHPWSIFHWFGVIFIGCLIGAWIDCTLNEQIADF